MALNRHVVKRSLGERTKTFLANNLQAIEDFLEPTVRGYGDEIRKLDGPRGRVLEMSFREARTAWEKFFWASLGRHWITADLALEDAVRHAEDDLMQLSTVLETVTVLERLASTTDKIKVKDLIDPSITCPISLQVCDDEILCEEDDLVSLDPTEEVDLEHPRVMLPSPRPLGAVPMEHIRPAGPEETTVVEGIRGRPKHYRT
jgi:hypothetical protein